MIKVIGDRVLVALPPKEAQTTTAGGLVLVRDPDLKVQTRGIVMAVGDKTGTVRLDAVCQRLTEECQEARQVKDVIAALKKLAPAPFDVAVGDCVLFPASAGDAVEWGGVTYVILHEAEIIGVLSPLTKDEAAA
jgi:co-chaperonin GroES (HSP10)